MQRTPQFCRDAALGLRPERRPEPAMSLARSVADVMRDHVTLEVEGIDRMYLNVFQPKLQYVPGVVGFFRLHRGEPVASSTLMDPMSKAFIAATKKLVEELDIPLHEFTKDERKDDVAAKYRAHYSARARARANEGVVFVGKAQEKTKVFRTERRISAATGKKYPWIVESTGVVNHFYFYCQDDDFGPFFLKFCTFFPYNAKLCINGHEYAKRQLAKEGIAFEALDNGVLSCANPKRLQEICDTLDAAKIEALLRKWLAKLPHPFSVADRQAGFRYDLSMIQMEFSLTQVLAAPHHGRLFFEQVIRDNLQAGRPDQVQLIFARRVGKRTPGRFRTRVLTSGVTPSLHIDYKSSRIKQYHKEGRALRTETTINNPRDFGIGKRLQNLPALRAIGFQANRRLLDVQQISPHCVLGETAFEQLNRPCEIQGQRVSALRYGDDMTHTLLSALLVFRLLPHGFANRDLREHWAPLLGRPAHTMTQGQMSYHLRRLRLRGLITRRPGTHRYQVTQQGFRIALFYTRFQQRLLRPAAANLQSRSKPHDGPLAKAFLRLENAIDQWITRQEMAA
jgi:hypothetical protein